MKHGDAFCGIGGFGLAARRVGWSTVWAAEINDAARAVYAARLGNPGLTFDRDIRDSRDLPHINILTGGFPCQDLSVAGRRGGLAASRSGLFFQLVRILQASRPEWFVFENVPGLLSSNRGRDMAIVLDSLVQCGYGVAYRILNAQFFGVAQRRERVFLVGHHSGEWERAAAVLFEPARSDRDPASGGEAGTEVAGTLGSNTQGGQRTTDLNTPFVIQNATRGAVRKQNGLGVSESGVCFTLDQQCDHAIVQQAISAKWAKGSSGPAGDEHHNLLVAGSVDVRTGGRSYSVDEAAGNRLVVAKPLTAGGNDKFDESRENYIVARPILSNAGRTYDSAGSAGIGPVNLVLGATVDAAGVRTPAGLPRSLDLCPICIEGPDGARYRGIGNAIVPVVAEWIFARINRVRRGEVIA